MKTNSFLLKTRSLLFFTLASLVIVLSSQAQEEDFFCPFDEDISTPSTPYDLRDVGPIPNLEPIVLNLFFWKVNNHSGHYNPWANPSNDFTLDNVLKAVSYLNRHYNEFNIFFKYIGHDSLNSPPNRQLYDPDTCDGLPLIDWYGYSVLDYCERTEFWNYVTDNGYKYPNAINIYSPFETRGFRGVANRTRSMAVIKPQDFENYVNPHEVAHVLGLNHTRSTIENVPRDPEDPDFNADVAGDKVVETAAIDKFRKGDENDPFPYVNLNTCEYDNDGTQQDSKGNEYEPHILDVGNIMSDCGPCMYEYNHFFDEQGHFMRNYVLDNPTKFDPLSNTIASLYEPYAGEYYISGPYQINKPLFQPGFRYIFRECECDCPEPSPYEDISFSFGSTILLDIPADETDFSLITHPNHSAIQIVFPTALPFSYGQTIRRCYDNWNGFASSGKVTRFNDGVFNTNVTIIPKDSTAINSPTLVDELSPGLYKVEKNYDDGASQETIIYKENE